MTESKRAYMKKYREENAEKILIHQREYWRSNKEKMHAKCRRYYEKHSEILRKKTKLYYRENKKSCLDATRESQNKKQGYYRNYARRNRAEIRLKALFVLGNACVVCGYNFDLRALQIDHIHNDGFKDGRERGGTRDAILRKIIKDGGHGRFQVLCVNCNWIKHQDFQELKYLNLE